MPSISSVASNPDGKSQIKVTLTEFIDFVTTSGSPKLTAVRTAKKNHTTKYDPKTDFYKPFRECVASMHIRQEPKIDLDALLADLQDPKKAANYPELAKGFCKFVKGRDLQWAAPPRAEWICGDLIVSINPELALHIDGQPYVIKMYLKSAKLTKFNVAIVNHLIELTLRPAIDPAIIGVLSVRKAKLHELQPATPGLTALLQGEAATFADIYRQS